MNNDLTLSNPNSHTTETSNHFSFGLTRNSDREIADRFNSSRILEISTQTFSGSDKPDQKNDRYKQVTEMVYTDSATDKDFVSADTNIKKLRQIKSNQSYSMIELYKKSSGSRTNKKRNFVMRLANGSFFYPKNKLSILI